KSMVRYNDVAAFTTYGTDRASAYRLLEDALNLRDIRIYDTIEEQTDGSAVSSTPRKPLLPRRSSSLSGMRSRTGFGKTRSGAKRWYGNTTRK
ncbi:hypothetical protein OBE_12895, partial [human gut metagenome]